MEDDVDAPLKTVGTKLLPVFFDLPSLCALEFDPHYCAIWLTSLETEFILYCSCKGCQIIKIQANL